MQIRQLSFLGLCLLATTSGNAGDRPVVLQSSGTQTSLLELYTSEGCSSCPPAEEWLSSLKKSSGLWKGFVPVAFHVDYWDRQGWRDPWASKTFSDRQRAYAASWRSPSVYTPGLVLNGAEWTPWPRPKDGPRAGTAETGTLKATSVDWVHWQVTFVPPGRGGGWYDAYGVLLANELNSDVKAGENKGRRLTHDFVALVLAKQPLKPSKAGAWGEIVLSPNARAPRPAVAFWVTRSGSMEVIQAVGGWLRTP
jgi:hypothetical protein